MLYTSLSLFADGAYWIIIDGDAVASDKFAHAIRLNRFLLFGTTRRPDRRR